MAASKVCSCKESVPKDRMGGKSHSEERQKRVGNEFGETLQELPTLERVLGKD